MKYIFCSENFKNFLHELQDNLFDTQELQQRIQHILPNVAKEINLGKLTVQFEAPITVYEPYGRNEEIELYSCDGGYENIPYTETMRTSENGIVQITTYSVKGYTWTNEEYECIKLLIQYIYLLWDRARMIELRNKSIMTDHLTGASSIAGLHHFSKHLISEGLLINYTGIFMNIKNFKYINRTVGNKLGDEFLKHYVLRVNSFLLPDEILARPGGDNLFALIKNERVQAYLDFISTVQICIDTENGIKTFDMAARAGIYPAGIHDSINDVIDCANVAIHVAKKSHTHDYVQFTPQMMKQALYKKEISNTFQQAVKNKEFLVFYQPKVSLSDNKLYGCEALVRWARDGRILTPDEFIPTLEQEGTICVLDFYILETICLDIRTWLDKNIEPVPVSVNFSKLHLYNPNLATDILAIIDKYHIDSKYIEIELTETSGYDNYEALSTFINCMKEHGVSTSIDDFGTGYSSLNLLKNLNVDVIKLDRSFLNNINNNADKIVIKSIVNMIHELGMSVITEGVETFEQAEFLKSIQCHKAQGFLYDRPLPHDEFEQRLTGSRLYERG